MPYRYRPNPAGLAAVFALYFALGLAGLELGGFTGPVAAVWPPSGFAVAALVIFGRQMWPAVFMGAALAYMSATGRIAASLTFAFGNTLEVVVAAVLLERFARGTDAFRSPPTIFRFVAIAGIVSAPLGAALAASATTLLGTSTWSSVAFLWVTCWFSSFTGTVVMTPFTMLWLTNLRDRIRWIELAESVLLLTLFAGACLVVFAGKFPADVQTYPLEFICVPFLLWTAFRLGRRGMSTAVLLLSSIAVWGTVRGFGPFVRDSQSEALVLVQAYVGVMAITGVVLAAVVAEHKQAERQLRELATTDPLTGLVNYRRLLEVLRAEIARSNRNGRSFAVVFVDMNGLKKINDKLGHLAGSRALCRLAEALRRSCRATDTAARYGGDEFAVVLPETTEAGGRAVLERIDERLAADPDKPALSVSGGVAVFPRDGETPTLLLRAADKLLYRAKAEAASARRKPRSADEERRTGTLF
jgi:diguanylate cyclase (GGDEF)-like protein